MSIDYWQLLVSGEVGAFVGDLQLATCFAAKTCIPDLGELSKLLFTTESVMELQSMLYTKHGRKLAGWINYPVMG